jgi:hypothetical protein
MITFRKDNTVSKYHNAHIVLSWAFWKCVPPALCEKEKWDKISFQWRNSGHTLFRITEHTGTQYQYIYIYDHKYHPVPRDKKSFADT